MGMKDSVKINLEKFLVYYDNTVHGKLLIDKHKFSDGIHTCLLFLPVVGNQLR